jgi:hypothetical protein
MYDKLKRRTLVPAMQQTVQNNNTIPNVGACNPIGGGMSVRQDGVSNVSYFIIDIETFIMKKSKLILICKSSNMECHDYITKIL